MAAQQPPLISLVNSSRGNYLVVRDGRSYRVSNKGTLQYPIEEYMEADQIALIENPLILGRPRYTPWYINCRSSGCKGNAIIKQLEDGSFFEYEIRRGFIITHHINNIIINSYLPLLQNIPVNVIN